MSAPQSQEWSEMREVARLARERREARQAFLRERVLSMHRDGIHTTQFMAERLGVTLGTVRRVLKELGLQPTGKRGGL